MKGLAKRLWNRLPRRLQEMVAAAVDRLQDVTPPPVPQPAGAADVRLFVGPVNYAGQGNRWSRAVEAIDRVAATNFVVGGGNPYRFEADYSVPWRTFEYSRRWHRTTAEELTSRYTHVLFESCKPVLGGLFGGDIRRQVALLQEAGLQVGFVNHGTDVRLPSSHRERVPWSPFHHDGGLPLEDLESLAQRNLDLLDELALPTFVSTAGLLADVPRAHFLGVVVDINRWSTGEPPLRRRRLRVIHAPTNPVTKGTLLISPVLRRLHEEGLIEYVQVGGLSQDEMSKAVIGADVLLDQFRIGDYGVAACEAMAAGRIALTYVTAEVRAEVERHAGMPLPIPDVDVESIEGVIRDIAARRDHYQGVAAQGPEFVRRLHDGSFARDVLMREFLKA